MFDTGCGLVGLEIVNNRKLLRRFIRSKERIRISGYS